MGPLKHYICKDVEICSSTLNFYYLLTFYILRKIEKEIKILENSSKNAFCMIRMHFFKMFQIEIDTPKLRLPLHQFVPFLKSYLFFKML